MPKNVFDLYLEALEAKQDGDNETAAKCIAEAVGGKQATEVIRGNVDRILKTGSRINRAVTANLFGSESSRRRREKGTSE